MKITFKNGLKKIKFYDRVLWTVLISFVLFVVFAFTDSTFLFMLFLLVFIISQATLVFGMYYWMFKTKNYLLLVLSIFIWMITILFYLISLRKKFKGGKYQS